MIKISLLLFLLFLFSQFFYIGRYYSLKNNRPAWQESEGPPRQVLSAETSKVPPEERVYSTLSLLEIPNNKFGMYINAESERIKEVAKLINSNGGDWGWVLIPYGVKERDYKHWQEILDECKKNHLKPVLQLYTTKFSLDYLNFHELANFLNSLSWPTKHYYVSLFNETNATYYWGDRKAPHEYAQVLEVAIATFKSVNPNFFILNGAFNSSARSGPNYLDEEEYLIAMDKAVPGIFEKLDGWATHTYPHPEFSGDFYNPPSWYETRDQIKNYRWEMELLKKHFGVSNLPVFITETGWAHKEGGKPKWQYKPAAVTAKYFEDAYLSHWLPDPQVVAIMPFIWYNEDTPNFNWVGEDNTFYPQYEAVLNIPKIKGTNY